MNRQPKWTDDPTKLCFAGILERYLAKLSPGQNRLFCKPATQSQMDTFREIGWKNAQMSPNQPLGVNSISLLFKRGAKLLGVNNPDTFGGHALRAYFLSKLYNSPEVSNVEEMCAGRHNSVAAGLTYVQRNAESEAGRFRALAKEMIPQRTIAPYSMLNSGNKSIKTHKNENDGEYMMWYTNGTHGY